ncbi:uncharacterized protein LOC120430730 [Culex pipiens pallens]|uniref:uncharacterized protein LOC120430730 n=1 Tax=Culex pipiens pallens TaxID=42434 RepID=UPI0019542350|nr:uncharacterized protein LOC120430730 [Culex pipiens pallens]
MQTSQISDIVQVEPGRDNPILLNFQNAEMSFKKDRRIQSFRAVDVNREAATKTGDDSSSTSSRMVVVGCDQQVYRGYVGEGLPTELMRSYVAIRNRKSGKMRLIQLEECTMLNACYDDNKNMFREEDHSKTAMRKFGGKVAMQALERIERADANIDVANESIQSMMEKYDESQFLDDCEFTKSRVEGELILASMKPPRNPDAKTAADLYVLDQLIPKSLLVHLKQVGLGFLEKEPDTLELANVYLTNKVKSVLQCKEPDSKQGIETLQISLFMDALVRLLSSKGHLLRKQELSPFSKQLDKEIKQSFSQINSHELTKTRYTEHKALTYYLALAFILENGTIDVEQIHNGLAISKVELLKFAAFIGGSYNSTKNCLVLRLGGSADAASGTFMAKRRFVRRK